MSRYTYAFTASWGGDTPTAELEVEVSYTVLWGAPEQGPSYACGGQPADADEVDDIRVETIEGKPRPWNLGYGFLKDDDLAADIIEKLDTDHHRAEMISQAAEDDDGPDPDDARDAAYDDERMPERDDGDDF